MRYAIDNSRSVLLLSMVMHNTTDKAARGEVSLHLNPFACPSPMEERKWGSLPGAVFLRLKPPLYTSIQRKE